MAVHTDVVVVGASIAGCTAAKLLAEQGADVTLVERKPDLDAYKVVCTHFVQVSAMATIRRLGLEEPLVDAGAGPAMVDIWTRYGWMRWPDEARHGLNVRRQVLDPMLRRRTVETPGVRYLPGRSVAGLVEDGGRVRGVHVRGPGGERETIEARVVVAADGRDSPTARLAGVPARVRPHGRVGYFAYFSGMELAAGERSQMWLVEPDVAYVFPAADGLTCVAAFFARDRRDEVRGDPEAAVRARFAGLPDAPDPWAGTRESKWIGKLELPNTRRPAAARGMAFVGDAAQASDPVWGVGCGFAFQSGEWLADELGGAVRGSDEGIDHALARYVRRHRFLAGHHWVMSDYATGRPLSPVERLLFSAAARDDGFARFFEPFGSREVRAETFLPRALVRAAAVNARHALARS